MILARYVAAITSAPVQAPENSAPNTRPPYRRCISRPVQAPENSAPNTVGNISWAAPPLPKHFVNDGRAPWPGDEPDSEYDKALENAAFGEMQPMPHPSKDSFDEIDQGEPQ